MRELKDYVMITLGLISYSLAWAAFLIPYQITTGGTTGIGAIIYYATGFPIQWSYFLIDAVLMTFAIKILGPKFSIKTTYAIFMLTFFLWLFQKIVNGPDGIPPQILGPGQDFMACLIGASMCGLGLGVVFNCNGSTGGTDIIAAIINKYKDVTLGQMMMLCDLIIITSSLITPTGSVDKLLYGYTTLIITNLLLDYVIDRGRQSVQFFIFSRRYDEIASAISATHRGVTVLNGQGWYTQQERKVLVVLAKKRESTNIFRIIQSIDPNAFVSQSKVIGVFGEGFDRIKVKAEKKK